MYSSLRMVSPHQYTTRLSAQTARRPAGTACDSAVVAESLCRVARWITEIVSLNRLVT